MEVMTPTNFRKDFFNNLKRIVKNNQPEEITISGDNNINDGVILVPKREWTRIQFFKTSNVFKWIFLQNPYDFFILI